MGNKDIGLKSYLGDAGRYADLWNGGVFQGKQVVKAEELREVDTVLPKADREAVLERTRDLVMKQGDDGQRFAVFVTENQSTVDYGMPVRIMLQEALEYDRQVKAAVRENEKRERLHREGKEPEVYHDAGERLYKFRKQDRLCPVATLVVYWGGEEWQGAKNLHDMINFGDESSPAGLELRKLVPEYPLHFLDLTSFEHMEYFKTELRPLLELYRRRNDKKEFVEYIEANEGSWEMDDESWHMLSQLTHSRDLKQLVKDKNAGKDGKKSMCKAIEDLKQDAKAEGKEEGRAEGRAEGKAEAIMELLEEHGEIPDNLRVRISAQKDCGILKKWLKLAARAASIQEFVTQM